MKKLLIFTFIIIPVCFLSAQKKTFQDGEWLKFRVHYGWFNASYATLQVQDQMIGDVPVFHIVGHGESTGLLDVFFKVKDTYESYIDKETGLPYKFVRNINEGGYKKHKILHFDQKNHTVKVSDLRHDKNESFSSNPNVQDMISVLYYIRNHIDEQLQEKGNSMVVNMFFDNKDYKFKTVYLGQETIKTKFGKIKCIKLRPYVQSGRVFKEKESLTVWISADENKIPVKIKAKLAVGSLTADLYAYKGLKHSLELHPN